MEVKKCNSLAEVRSEIDKIDEKIIELISGRSKLVRQAANFKNSVAEIKSDDRVRNVINKTRTQAIQLGLSPVMVEKIFRGFINDMIAFEIEEFNNAKSF